MGLILDSSVLIKAERQGQNARQMLTAIARTMGNTEIALSVITLLELAHGAARADTAQRKETRQRFIQENLTITSHDGQPKKMKAWEAEDLNGFPVKIEMESSHGLLTMQYKDVSL